MNPKASKPSINSKLLAAMLLGISLVACGGGQGTCHDQCAFETDNEKHIQCMDACKRDKISTP